MTYRRPTRLARVTDPPEDEEGSDDASLRLFLRRVPGGQTVGLTESAALIWLLAVDGEEDVPQAVADVTGEPIERIRGDVVEFLDRLVRDGLLEVVR